MSNTEHWIETKWSVPKADADSFEDIMQQMGGLGSFANLEIEEVDENKKTHFEFQSYFADQDPEQLKNKLSPFLESGWILNEMSRIPQGNWATEWKKYFKPFYLTERVVIRPSWEEYTAKDKDIVVTLDPGMAFGTGQHDTTKFCSDFLCELKDKHPNLKEVLDIGCGSGILSIIARKLGFEKVIGTDIDPAAIETCFENLDRNPDAKPIEFKITKGDPAKDGLPQSELVVCNIIAEILVELKQSLTNLIKPNGLLVLSGIIPDRSPLIKNAFQDLELLDSKESEFWHAYLYRKS